MTVRAALAGLALLLNQPLIAGADPLDVPASPLRPAASRPAAMEFSWTPLRLPTGERIALAGFNYLLAVDEDWGFGPSLYGAAQGNYGGFFTFGISAQRRLRLSAHTHLALGLSAVAGGGLSSDRMRPGGGLMLRPEISLRTEFGDWYAGIALSHVGFPSGNIGDGSVGLVLGRALDFHSFAPADAGRRGTSRDRSGVGFDEILLFAGSYAPEADTRDRSGNPSTARLGTAGGEGRRYLDEGSWWSLEAAGATSGNADGYMDVFASAGQDWALGDSGLRLGGRLGLGLGGGGNVDTGSGWLWRAGPSLRWQTPWGPSLHLDAGWNAAFGGHFSARYLRLSLGLPLEARPQPGGGERRSGTVREQQFYSSVQYNPDVLFKDGRREPVTHLAIMMTRQLDEALYGIAQAGSAAFGHAGAYSFGLIGLGLQSHGPQPGQWRVGAEALLGAGGGGGLAVGGGAIAQWELWAQRDWDRLRLRAGLGQWRSLASSDQSTPLLNLSLGYAYGVPGR
ncbi:hypothetical protein [Roseateles violae]|uniref:Uncharacterized protein n=1 Tax=Roseateles violae TaxID=3058042 RepID=A0ABT8DSN5_9BURK|nr:hypothetical protein [Pelomonas sp. PFR6]MDN3921340.1 hypothetical protein [Pelomonas sp. PFR6]